MSLELSGAETSRPHIEAAAPEHPSLIDATHQLDSLFGVVNIPNVIWIDEAGVIVRPPEPGWAGESEIPEAFAQRMAEKMMADLAAAEAGGPPKPNLMEIILSGQDRDAYPDAIRDWAAKGADSEFALTPDEVIERSNPRGLDASRAAAHFELANHLWRAGQRDAAVPHFNACHRLQPENWTYKRQAWSMVGNERDGGEFGHFSQGPVDDNDTSWPFDTSFDADVGQLEPGQYYPATM